MIPEKTIELIHKEIDGELTSNEKSSLQDLLKNDPEAQKLYDNLMSTAGHLEKMPDIDPPPDLKEGIMAGLDENLYRSPGEGTIFMADKEGEDKW